MQHALRRTHIARSRALPKHGENIALSGRLDQAPPPPPAPSPPTLRGALARTYRASHALNQSLGRSNRSIVLRTSVGVGHLHKG